MRSSLQMVRINEEGDVRTIVMCVVLLLAATGAAAQSTVIPLKGPCADVVALQKAFDRDEARLADWPNLGRFREANGELPPPAPGQPRVVFLGDSITDNWNNAGFGGFFPGKGYINRGISGQTTPQMLLRFRADVLAHKPAVVVLLAGTNDIAGNTGPMSMEAIQGNIESMTELAAAHGARMVLSSVMPVNDVGHSSDGTPVNRTRQRPPEKIVALNNWMRDYAKRQGLVYLDYAAALSDEKGMLRADLADDGLHPNVQGYAIIAPLAERAIQQALGQKR